MVIISALDHMASKYAIRCAFFVSVPNPGKAILLPGMYLPGFLRNIQICFPTPNNFGILHSLAIWKHSRFCLSTHNSTQWRSTSSITIAQHQPTGTSMPWQQAQFYANTDLPIFASPEGITTLEWVIVTFLGHSKIFNYDQMLSLVSLDNKDYSLIIGENESIEMSFRSTMYRNVSRSAYLLLDFEGVTEKWVASRLRWRIRLPLWSKPSPRTYPPNSWNSASDAGTISKITTLTILSSTNYFPTTLSRLVPISQNRPTCLTTPSPNSPKSAKKMTSYP